MKMIELTKGYVAFVDDEDFERVSVFKWSASVESRGTKVYAKRRRLKSDCPFKWAAKKIRMHHFILGVSPSELNGLVIDHLDGNSLNNCKANLEAVTQDENMSRVKTWKGNSNFSPSL